MQIVQASVAFVFGVSFIIALLVLALKHPNPTAFQYTVFRIVLSLAAAGAAAMIPGFINVEFSPIQGFLISAGGATAVLVIVYFFDPARLVATPPGTAPSPPPAPPKDQAINNDKAKKDQ
jgi:hypothetical protein